jgi:MerR family transcriptional regulator, repressor of the yfmOP operon
MTIPAKNYENQAPADQAYYTIEQVASRTQLTRRTLRYYEEMGLLYLAERTEGNYRRYTEDDIQRIEHIKALRNLLGFSLNDIRDFLLVEEERKQVRAEYRAESDTNSKIASLDHADELIQAQIQLIEQKIASLEQMREDLLSRQKKHIVLRQELHKK